MAAITIFDRLDRGQPQPAPTEAVREDPTVTLLTWLIKHWGQPTITLRDVLRLGPRPLRNKETILRLTQSLEDKSWLAPVPTRRCNGQGWRIMRGLPLN
jgi:hypothetical protein